MIFGALPKPPRFLTSEEVETMHAAAIEQYGGSHGIRDQGLLESALAMPRQSFGGQFAHEIPFGMAAAYGFHICKNHAFVDGNKRAAFLASVIFLRVNGWELHAPEDEITDTFLSVAAGGIDKAKLTQWISDRCKPRPTLELRDFFVEMDYQRLGQAFAGIAAGNPDERVASIVEAGRVIPAVHAANLGAMRAQQAGDHQAAMILHQHAMLLTAIYRIAEDSGYEW